MSRDHAAFAAELREDAARLRAMADALDVRAEQHAQTAQAATRAAKRFRQEIDEDNCAFGIRYIGSSLAPTLDYT